MPRVFSQDRFTHATVVAMLVTAVGSASGRAQTTGRLVVESSLAREMSLSSGDTVHVRLPGATGEPHAFVVSGVYAPPPDPAGISRTSRLAWMPITDLEAL